MISVLGFKSYAGWPSPALKAAGIVVISRQNTATTNVISIPQGSEFLAQPGIRFLAPERSEISESSQRVEMALQAKNEGILGNIEANRLWLLPRTPEGESINGILISNPSAFVGGQDAVKTSNPSVVPYATSLSDAVLKDHLDISKNIVRGFCGLSPSDEDIDDKRFDFACYLLCLFFLENQSTQQVDQSFQAGSLTTNRISFYRNRMEKAVYRRVTSLIRPWMRSWRFVPPYKQPVEASA